jgi:adenine phosphoribosyltransferase
MGQFDIPIGSGAFMERLKSYIRDIPDFPKPGILFKDITPLVKNPATLRLTVHQLLHPFLEERINAVAGMEARGFIFGALVAWELGVGFIPLRKPGKLPYNVHTISYDLEYGSAALEVHIDALEPGDRVLLIDDLLATGGTARASCELVEQSGAEVAGCAFVIELDDLRGREVIGRYRVHSLMHF